MNPKPDILINDTLVIDYRQVRFVRTCENRRPSLTGVHIAMDRMRFTNVSEVLWQGHDRWACQVDRRAGHGAILPRARSSARAATAEHA